ncbi:MAG TPA: GNAT family N-acetyltransferase, partial [Actinospica sp.]|nr:GNAT family N-acetyltransferase [Actinospica sp.]
MNAMTTAAITRFGAYAEMPAVMLDDALLRIETDPGILHGAWSLGEGYAFASVDAYGGEPCWLNVVGPAQAAAALTEIALAELGAQCFGITVPRGVDTARWSGGREAGEWDLMRCDEPPAFQPGEERVAHLTDLAAVQAFLDQVNPSHSVRADHPEVERWMGVAQESSGTLLAVGAFTRRRAGTGYLASIATAEQARGQGLGGAVTAALTRHAFATGDALCTLAHFHPNEPARRMYLRLGYR